MDKLDRIDRRPRAPDLQVYRPTLTMVMSIAHRVTGAVAYFAMLLLIWWLLAVAAGPGPYRTQQDLIGSIPGQVILFGLTWALIHHALGGIRHLIWDTGRAHDYPWREYLARATIIGSVAFTCLVWIIGYVVWRAA